MKKKEIKKLDTLWSKLVKERAGHRCEVCGNSAGRLNSHHIISKGVSPRALRWDLDNGICVCFRCHVWFHGNPVDSGRWLIEKKGKAWWDLLKSRDEVGKKYDFEEIMAKLNLNTFHRGAI